MYVRNEEERVKNGPILRTNTTEDADKEEGGGLKSLKFCGRTSGKPSKTKLRIIMNHTESAFC